MRKPRDELMDVLHSVRALLALPDNDYSWSSWEDAHAALTEVDQLLHYVQHGQLPSRLEILFAVTGPIQEVCMSSGWCQEYLEVADRFDKVIKQLASEPKE